jgi:hypothetical protein
MAFLLIEQTFTFLIPVCIITIANFVVVYKMSKKLNNDTVKKSQIRDCKYHIIQSEGQQ